MVQISGPSKSLEEVGEFGLIEGISNLMRSSKVTSSGLENDLGDDAALWRPRLGRQVIVTTDLLVERVHFRHSWSKAESIGHRALAVNISDIAAMGGRPRVAVIALGLKGSESDRWVYEMYRGALKLGEKFHFKIAGGDIVSAPRGTTISVTMLGDVSPGRPALQREAAQAGDVIGVTGPLGLAAAGVRLLSDDNLKLDGAPRMMDAHRKPQPRVLQGILLRWAGVRCAMDLSDGLLGDLPKLCAASGVSATIEEDRLPIPHAVRWGFPDWFDLALRGGEDFELLFTCSEEHFLLVEMLFKRYGCPPPVRIGKITEQKDMQVELKLLKTDRRLEDLEPGSFQHFGRKADG